MKKVWVSNRTKMVLESLVNIDVNHNLYNTFYETEVDDNFHVHVSDEAVVSGDALVGDYAIVFGKARACDNAEVYGNAVVFGDAIISGDAIVYGYAVVTRDTISIVGLPCSITLTDNHIQIGCKQFTFEHAKKLAERNIDIDGNTYDKMIKYKDLLLGLIRVRELEK